MHRNMHKGHWKPIDAKKFGYDVSVWTAAGTNHRGEREKTLQGNLKHATCVFLGEKLASLDASNGVAPVKISIFLLFNLGNNYWNISF